MEWLADWLNELILLILVATFLDMLLPNNSLDRYVKLVMGLLIIMAILHPIFQLINNQIDWENLTLAPEVVTETSQIPSMEQIKKDGEKLQERQVHYLQEQLQGSVEEWTKKQLENNYAVEVMNVEAETELNEEKVPVLKRLSVVVQPSGSKSNESHLTFRPIEPIEIGEEESVAVNQSIENAKTKEMERYLLDHLTIEPQNIEVRWHEGV